MARKFDKELASVVEKDGFHYVILPSGELFPCVKATITECDVDGPANVTLKATVNIVSTVDEALKMYGDNIISLKIDGEEILKNFDKNSALNLER